MVAITDFSTNRKFQELHRTARDLFWKYGFKRISIEELCHKAGISKMTYYRFYPNKIELAKSVFENVVNEGIQRFRDIMRADIPPSEKVRQFISLKYDGTNNLSQEFLQDFYEHSDTELSLYVDRKVNQSWEEVLADFRMAQEKGWFRKDLKPEFLFYIVNKMDFADKELMKLFSSPQEMVMEMITFFMYGMLPRP